MHHIRHAIGSKPSTGLPTRPGRGTFMKYVTSLAYSGKVGGG